MKSPVANLDHYRYQAVLSGMDLAELIGKYETYENMILEDCKNWVLRTLSAKDEVRGSRIWIDGLEFDCSVFRGIRELFIVILPVKGAETNLPREWFESRYGKKKGNRRYEALQLTPIPKVELNEFGFVRRVNAGLPQSLLSKYENLPHHIAGIYKRAYRALQNAFIAACKRDKEVLSEGIDTLLLGVLQNAGDVSISEKHAYFSVSHANDSQFQYKFIGTQIDNIVKEFIAAPHLEHSPFELASALVCQEAVDSLWKHRAELEVRRGKTISVAFADLDNVETLHWGAESALIGDANLVAIELCECGGLVLWLNCRREFARVIAAAVNEDLDSFLLQFSKNVSRLSRMKRAAEAAFKRARTPLVVGVLLDLAKKIVLDPIATIIKHKLHFP